MPAGFGTYEEITVKEGTILISFVVEFLFSSFREVGKQPICQLSGLWCERQAYSH